MTPSFIYKIIYTKIFYNLLYSTQEMIILSYIYIINEREYTIYCIYLNTNKNFLINIIIIKTLYR